MGKRVKLAVVERKLGREKASGLYWPDKALAEVDPNQPPKEYLDTVVHEVLHHALQTLSERRINTVSRTISRTLWKMGYRKVVGA